VRCFLRLMQFLARKPTCSSKPSPKSPSVPSVLCFLPLDAVSRPEANVFIQALSSTNPRIPLCGLRDLCAMLSPFRAVSRTEANVFIQALSSTNPKSPSVASVSSVRCFLRLMQFLARKPTCSSKLSRPRRPNPPLWPIQLKRCRTISGPSPRIRRGIPRLAQGVDGIEQIESPRPR
jgi:hypothetical protein